MRLDLDPFVRWLEICASNTAVVGSVWNNKATDISCQVCGKIDTKEYGLKMYNRLVSKMVYSTRRSIVDAFSRVKPFDALCSRSLWNDLDFYKY